MGEPEVVMETASHFLFTFQIRVFIHPLNRSQVYISVYPIPSLFEIRRSQLKKK